jgi:hypothetical protein
MKHIRLLLSGLLIVILSCSKDQSNRIPDVVVNFQAPLTDPRISKLNSPGGVVTIDNIGVAGVIIYHSQFNGLVAYDRCSSVNPEKRCAVIIDNTGFTATDTCSMAIFSLEDGNPAKPPAKRPLKAYKAFTSNGVLFVIN